MSDSSGQPSRRHLSSYHVELARLGRASAADRAFIDEHLRTCARCAQMAASFEDARREFATTVLPRTRAALEARRARRRRFSVIWWWGGLLVPVAASMIVFAPWRRSPSPPPAVGEPEIGVKGGVGFFLAARRGDRVFPVRPGDPLRPGDQIRFVLERVRYPYVLIASIDGAGHASIYVPYEGSASTRVAQDDHLEIPGSIVIDASPGPERMFAFLSRQPLSAAPVRQALAAVGARGGEAIRRANKVDVGADEQVTILVEKAVP